MTTIKQLVFELNKYPEDSVIAFAPKNSDFPEEMLNKTSVSKVVLRCQNDEVIGITRLENINHGGSCTLVTSTPPALHHVNLVEMPCSSYDNVGLCFPILK